MSPLWTTTSGASSAAGATRSADTRLHPSRQSLVLTVSGVVINADTPSETVIALPPGRTVPRETAACNSRLAPGERVAVRLRVGEGLKGDPVPRNPGRIERFTSADGQATRFDPPAGLEAVVVVPNGAVRTKTARAALPETVAVSPAGAAASPRAPARTGNGCPSCSRTGPRRSDPGRGAHGPAGATIWRRRGPRRARRTAATSTARGSSPT